MDWRRALLVIGFLLWDQNHFSSGQGPPSSPTSPTKNDSNSTTTQAPNAITDLTHPLSGKADDSNSIATQAPNSINGLTPSLNGTAGPSSSDFTTSALPASTTVTLSTPRDEAKPRNCNIIGFQEPSYNNSNTELIIENVTEPYNITCDPQTPSNRFDFIFTLGNYTFNIDRCKPQRIRCKIDGCGEPIEVELNAPPAESDYTLDVIRNSNSTTLTWGTGREECNVNVSTTCFHGTNNISVTGTNTVDLDPCISYTCTSKDSYGRNLTGTENKSIKPIAPEVVENLKCTGGNKTITIKWDPPKKTNGPLKGYIITSKTLGIKEEITQKRSHIFNNLKPFSSHSFEVEAYSCDKGNTGPRKEISCRTLAEKPSEVQRVKAFPGPTHNNEVTITCNVPNELNGGKGGFILKFNGRNYGPQKDCHFVITGLSYLSTYKYELYYENGNNLRGDPFRGEVHTRYNDKALIGFLVFLIIMTCIALIFVLYKIYKLQQKNSTNNEDSIPLTSPDDESSLLNIGPIYADFLLETFKNKNADEGRLFLDEFQSIPRVFSRFPIKEARKPCNQPKNRYIDILPYDGNRVILSEVHGEPGSDYINASYVNGLNEPRKYIAAQGPKEETVNDFWKMIWEQKSTIIVMVTRCEEGNRNKCAQYWPSAAGQTKEYGDVVAKLTDEKFFPDYITRKLHVTHKREKSERDITHIQFTVWPDHGVPDDPNLLLKLRRRVKALSNFFSGPIVVHCSAGVGRTGTYISIDAMLEGLDTESRVDVYGFVVQLRRQRCLMVQVDSQYIFIHKALVKYNQFGETEISMAELPATLSNLKNKDAPSEPSQLMCEFQRLPSYKNWRPQNTGNHQDNKEKNRCSSVIPYEFNRVLVKLDDEQETAITDDSEMSSDEESDSEETVYINASYITGYWGPRDSIATQEPLKKTLPEFWKMIFQKRVKAIVMISGPGQENDEGTCAPYWNGKSNVYEDLEVELCSETPCGSHTERCFEIRHVKRKDVRKVTHFHYEQWGGDIPTETKGLLEMIEKIKTVAPTRSIQEQNTHDKSVPLAVHCSDGAHATGVFCALWHLIESANVEGVVDVFQVVKNLRKERSGMLSSFEQYEFLYDTLASTVPIQNGQIHKPAIKQEVQLEIHNEIDGKVPESEETPVTISVEEPQEPKEEDKPMNGPDAPDAAGFEEVSLRIDE